MQLNVSTYLNSINTKSLKCLLAFNDLGSFYNVNIHALKYSSRFIINYVQIVRNIRVTTI